MMTTWSEVQDFISRHKLNYRVERYNMSLRGTLVYDNRVPIAFTVRSAAAELRHALSGQTVTKKGAPNE